MGVDAAPEEPLGEPVHFGARLWVVPGAPYTEVDATVVAVVPDTARVVRLTPDSAALVAALDGRAVHDVLADELAGWDRAQRRRIIELLRQVKALGLVVDAPAGAPARTVDWFTPVPRAGSVTVAVQQRPGGDGMVHLAAPDDQAMDRVTLTAADAAPAGLVLPVVPSAPGHRSITDAPGAVAPGVLDTFVALVRAVDPRSRLVEPGVVDLLAVVAERTPAVWADPDGSPSSEP